MRCRLAASEKKAKTSPLGRGSLVDALRTWDLTLPIVVGGDGLTSESFYNAPPETPNRAPLCCGGCRRGVLLLNAS